MWGPIPDALEAAAGIVHVAKEAKQMRRTGEVRVTVDREECIACGTCYEECPEVFEEDPQDGLSRIVEAYRIGDDPAVGQVPDGLVDCVRTAAEGCPVEAIQVEE
jgi:ferredoxin